MKLKSKLLFSGIFAAMIFGVVGCKTTDVDEKEAKKQKIKLEEINKKDAIQAENSAKKLAAGYFQAVRDENYELYIKGRPEEVQKNISRDKFKQMVNYYKKSNWKIVGKPRYLGSLNKHPFRDFLWGATVQADIKDPVTKKIKTRKTDTFFYMSMGKVDDKYLVFFFGDEGDYLRWQLRMINQLRRNRPTQ